MTSGLLAKKRRLVASAGVAFALLAGVAALHSPVARPVLRVFSGKTCPFAHSATLAPAKREALRRYAVLSERHSEAKSPSRDALGFELGTATRADVETKARLGGASCKSESGGTSLSCARIPPNAIGETGAGTSNVYFRFDPANRLVAVLRMAHVEDPVAAERIGTADRTELREKLGMPTRETGDVRAAYLASAPFRQARVEHRFSDFAASASVTHMGADYLVTEEAQLTD